MPQFRLGTLMLAVGGLGIMFAAIRALGAYASLGLGFGMLCVLAHVAGNAIGTRLRQSGDRVRHMQERPAAGRPKNQALVAADFAPATRLRRRESLGLPSWIGTLLGALGGGILAAYLFQAGTWPGARQPHLVVAIVTIGILGGLAMFVATSFTQVALSCLRQATRDVSHRREVRRGDEP